MDFLVGGYGPDMGGGARGIGWLGDGPGGARFRGTLAGAPSPSWICVSGNRAFAALEGRAQVASFLVEGAFEDGAGPRLRLVSQVPAGGAAPCHAALARDPQGGEHLIVACYGDGTVAVHSVGPGGRLSGVEQAIAGAGSGPLPAQAGPHAHCALPLADGRVLTSDLGADCVHVNAWDGGRLRRVGSVRLEPGTGPRDLLPLAGDAVAVLGEWGCTVTVLAPRGRGFQALAPVALGASAGDQAASLARVDGPGARRFLYAGLRGSDRLVALADAGGRAGAQRLRVVARVPAGGRHPRHIRAVGRRLYVCAQKSDRIAMFDVDARGLPRPAGGAPAPAPTALAPL